MAFLGDSIQKYERIYEFIADYHKTLYDFYSKHAVAFLITYYNHDVPETIWDDKKLFGGSYEYVGDLSGRKFNKILFLPVYFMEDVSTAFDGQDIGYVKEGQTSFVIPSTYGLTPYAGDFLKFDQTFLRQTNDIYPTFHVTGVELSVNTDFRFWKMTAKVFDSKTIDRIEENNLQDVWVFSEYDKKIHTFEDGQFITNMLTKNEKLRAKLRSLYDPNSGFYFI